MTRLSLAAIALVVLVHDAAAAADMSAADEQERMTLAGGAWQAGKNVPCAAGVVTSVHSRLEESPAGSRRTFESGVAVEFKLPSVPKFLNGQPLSASSVVHYDGDRSNKLMESEKAGDKVQVCLVSFPTPTHDLQTGKTVCDPNVDPRGLVFRVYDYARHAAYIGQNSEHGCGGA